MEPAGGHPRQGHQAQAGGGVLAEQAVGRRATAAASVAVATAPTVVAPVPELGRPAMHVGRRRWRREQAAVTRRGRLRLRLQRVPGSRVRTETRTGRTAGPSYRNGGGEPVERGADPSTARRTQIGRVREPRTRGTPVRRQADYGRDRHEKVF